MELKMSRKTWILPKFTGFYIAMSQWCNTAVIPTLLLLLSLINRDAEKKEKNKGLLFFKRTVFLLMKGCYKSASLLALMALSVNVRINDPR